MFGIGLPELILIMALALIVVGPDKLPGLAKNIAKQILELKKTANSLKDSLQEELHEEKQLLEDVTSITMKENPLLDVEDATEGQSHYPDLKEGAAPDQTSREPEAFNAYDEAVTACEESKAEKENNPTEKDAGEKS
jgi:sec-independent protein translocase protein TatB